MTPEMLKKMKDKLENIQSGAGSKDRPTWKPELGSTNYVRFLPDKEDPFAEFWFHYGVGGKSFMCPKRNFGKPCACCDFAESLWEDVPENPDPEKAGKPDYDSEEYKQAKAMTAVQRFYSRVIVRGQEDRGPLWYNYSKTVFKQLLTTLLDENDGGDFTDVTAKHGFDWKLKYEKGSKSYPETTLTVARSNSPLFDDQSKVKEVLADLPAFDEVWKPVDSDFVKQCLHDHLSGGDEDGDKPADEGDVKYGGDEDSSASDAGGDDIDSKMQDFLNA